MNYFRPTNPRRVVYVLATAAWFTMLISPVLTQPGFPVI